MGSLFLVLISVISFITTDLPREIQETLVADEVTEVAQRAELSVHLGPTDPPPFEWHGPIPSYGSSNPCTQEQATYIALQYLLAGADEDTVVWALRMFSRESGCDHTAYNGNRNTGDNSVGLCQTNILAGFFKPGEILGHMDPWYILENFEYSVEACVTLWAACGRGPWNYGNYYCRSPF